MCQFLQLSASPNPDSTYPAPSSPGGEHEEGPACGPRPAFLLSSDPIIDLNFQQRPQMKYHLLSGAAAPEISQLGVEFSDGTRTAVELHDGNFVVLYPREVGVVGVSANGGDAGPVECDVRTLPPDGHELSCHARLHPA